MVRDGEDLTQIPGVGKAISDKITELVNTNRMGFFDRLKGEFPDGMLDLMRVPGLGPKTISRAWKELDVTNVAELERAAEDGRLASLPRLGQKTADNILRNIRFARDKDRRTPIAQAMPAAERIIAAMRERRPDIAAIAHAGSLRRFEETVGDLDIVCATDDAPGVLSEFVALPQVAEVLGTRRYQGVGAAGRRTTGGFSGRAAAPIRLAAPVLHRLAASQHTAARARQPNGAVAQ